MCSQFALALLANGFFHELRSTLMRPPDIYLEAELHQARLPLHSYFLGEALAAAHSSPFPEVYGMRHPKLTYCSCSVSLHRRNSGAYVA